MINGYESIRKKTNECDIIKSFYYNYTPKNETKDKTVTNETKEIKEKSLFETLRRQ